MSLSEIHEGGISGALHQPSRPVDRAIGLTHGAGGNSGGAFLKALADKLAESGWLVLRYDLPFRQARKSGPPYPAQAAKDRDGVREVARFLRERASTVVLGGQSYGGRQTTMAAAESPEIAAGLLLLSYPLHPPGKPDQLRTEHFPKLALPCCFVQGTRDPFATPEEIGAAIRAIPRAELRIIEKAGHSLPPGSAPAIAAYMNAFDFLQLMGMSAASKRMKPMVQHLFLLAGLSAVASAAGFDHSRWDQVLKTRVNAIGEVDYAAVKAAPGPLAAYLKALAEASPENRPALFPTREDKLAYWLNAYNALVTHGVAQGYPTKSVRSLGLVFGFFRQKVYLVGGRKMSLDDIEHGTIRKQFQEPRIHFAIVCASLSCPRLQHDAFTPDRVMEQLEAATRQFFSERRNLEWDLRRGSVTLTSLLKWYRGDFVGGGSDRELLNWIALHLPAHRAAQLKAIARPRLAYRDYDWAINDPGSRARAKDPAERELR